MDQGAMTLSMADLSRDGSRASGPRPGKVAGPRAGQPVRRSFTDAFKLAFLDEYESASERGARAALLRREGLYESTVRKWQLARDRGRLSAATSVVAKTSSAEAAEMRRLRRENERLAAELQRTRAVLDVVGKVHDLLETLSEHPDDA